MSEIALTLASSMERVKLCKGLLEHRKALRNLGVTQGVQWIDGSFCEDVESTRRRPPGDVDVVTLLTRPPTHQADADWFALINSNLDVFESRRAKAVYGCDAFFIDVGLPGLYVIHHISYWFGLFTHQKVSNLWKGILQVPLASDDVVAEAHIDGLLTPVAPLSPPVP